MAPPNDTPQGPGEQQRGEPRKGMISGQTFSDQEVTFSAIGDRAVFEGDIVLGTVADLEKNLRDGHTSQVVQLGLGITGYRWPGGEIPYQFAPGFTGQERVTEAIKHWEARTRIRFVLRDGTNATEYRDYVEFEAAEACYSAVGMQGGRQVINLGPECGTGNAIHEIGHTVGLWHEQSRKDRGQHVDIKWENINPAMKHEFDQHITDGDDIGDYDYGSIMHYRRDSFSINGKDTIVPKQAGVTIGQRNGLSAGDVAAVESMYPRRSPRAAAGAANAAKVP